MKRRHTLLLVLLGWFPMLCMAQLHTVHAIHSTGAWGFNSSIAPHSVDHYLGYLTVADYSDGGGSNFDIHLMWGDTCRGYNAKSRYYRTSGNNVEYATGVRMDPTGDMWVTGVSSGTTLGLDDAILLRVDTAANLPLVFSRAYGGTGYDAFFGLSLTSDGGAILLGQSNSFGATSQQGYVVKVDAAGALQWSRQIGGTSNDLFMDAVEMGDGSYLLLGTSFSFTPIMSMWLVRLSSTGSLISSRVINNPSSNWSVGYSLFKTLDGGYIINGANVNGTVNPNDADGMLMKLDANLAVQWTRLYGDLGWDDLIDFTPTDDDGDLAKDDGYLLVGYSGSLGADDDYWYVKTDASGNLQWSRGWDEGIIDNGWTSVEQLSSEEGYFMVGTHDKYGASKLITLRTKPDGTGNFSCPTPAITPRVLSVTRSLINVSPPTSANTSSVNAAITSYGQLAAIAVCCCDNWPANCGVAPLDEGRSIWLAAQASGRSVDLSWQTDATGIDEFRVWMGTHPAEMAAIGTVGSGVREVTQPVSADGLHYFQIEAIDRNGETFASEVRSVMIGRSEAIWLGANPVHAGAAAQLHIQGAPHAQHLWEVIDLHGRRLIAESILLDAAGAATIAVPTTQLAGGTYFVRVNGLVQRLLVD